AVVGDAASDQPSAEVEEFVPVELVAEEPAAVVAPAPPPVRKAAFSFLPYEDSEDDLPAYMYRHQPNQPAVAGTNVLTLVVALVVGARAVGGVWYSLFTTRAKAADVLTQGTALPAGPADWPQWRGPARNGISKDTGLLKKWPKEGPKALWTFDNAGLGFSGPAVVAGKLFTLGARAGTEFVFALDTQTGKEVWAVKIGPLYVNRWGDGPRSTPTADGDRLFALGANGDLVCLETASGKLVWQINLQEDLQGDL